MKREELKQKSGTEYRCLKCGQHWDYDDDACPECGSRNIEAYLIRIKCDVSAGKNVTKSHVNTDKNVTNDPPPAECAEEILERVMYENGFTYVSFPAFVENESSIDVFDIACKAMTEFATLHARKMAEEMVEENLVEFGNMIRDEPNGDIAALAEYFIRTINLKSRGK